VLSIFNSISENIEDAFNNQQNAPNTSIISASSSKRINLAMKLNTTKVAPTTINFHAVSDLSLFVTNLDTIPDTAVIKSADARHMSEIIC
jgi:hypothetical protein